ncbi:Cellulose-binding protein [Apiospora saccharicola]|uniref:Cellulose-binding protein n=1 Tax=Apiospora saccharicola TaxID=335842 RepID=A0ABR1V8P4_9PEZI
MLTSAWKYWGACCFGLATLSLAAPGLAPGLEAHHNSGAGARANATTTPKPRMIAMTDVVGSDVEPDDMQSLVHLLSVADMFQIDGIVATTGWNLDGRTEMYRIFDVIDAYEKDLPNLMKRSGQTEFLDDEVNQFIGYWPSAAYLRGVVAEGQTMRGMGGVGDDKATNGSRLATSILDRDDPYERPLWISFWGSGNTLAQSLWDVRRARSAEEVDTFLSRVRVYTVTDQDRPFYPENNYTDVPNTAQTWMREAFGSKLFYIWSETAWRYLGQRTRDRWPQYRTEVQGKGALGSIYPDYKYVVEGDTSSWVYPWPGVSDPEDPTQWGFGGRFVDMLSPDNKTRAYMDLGDDAAALCKEAISRSAQDQTNDFVSRIEWAASGSGNRNPVVVVNGDSSYQIVTVGAAPGAAVTISAVGTADPDGDALSYAWTQDTGVRGAGWVDPAVLNGASARDVSFTVPEGAAGRDVHLVLRVVDDGVPALATWRRVIAMVTAS